MSSKFCSILVLSCCLSLWWVGGFLVITVSHPTFCCVWVGLRWGWAVTIDHGSWLCKLLSRSPRTSRNFLHGLQNDGVIIDVNRFLYLYDLSYTWKVPNSKNPSRIELSFANQNLIGGIRQMKHTSPRYFGSCIGNHSCGLFPMLKDYSNVHQSSISTIVTNTYSSVQTGNI